jgi:periplasmic copper chaperone A
MPWPALAAGAVVALLGVGGLVGGAMPQGTPASSSSADASGAPIVVSGAYVHPPVAPTTTAAAYFTIDNTTSNADRLIGVESGAGADTVLHTTSADGSMMTSAGGVTVRAHGSIRFTPGGNHVMIEKVYGRLKVGQSVNLELDFAKAGSIDVTAKVVPLGTESPTVPTGGHS